MKIYENYNLAPLSTFKIGGKAKYCIFATNREELLEAIRYAQEKGLAVAMIGGGSNLLISDEGVEGVVIKYNSQDFNIQQNLAYFDAGLSLSVASIQSINAGLSGLEWGPAVPGSIGGAIRGNAGAFGGDTQQFLKSIVIYSDNRIQEVPKDILEYGYRWSDFKGSRAQDIILGGYFELQLGKKQQSLDQMKSYVQKKQSSQPLAKLCSGCVFKNYEGQIDSPELIQLYPELAQFNLKKVIPVGYLIEQLGLKGEKKGGIEISQKHANYMLNDGTGTYAEVTFLIQKVKQHIQDLFKISVQEEVSYLHRDLKEI